MDKNCVKGKEFAKIEICKLWESIKTIFSKNYDVNNERLVLRLDTNNIPQIYFELKRKRAKTDEFAVHIKKEGIVLSTKEMNADDILLKFIKIVGVEDVQGLGLKTIRNTALISDNSDNDSRRKPIGDKYVYVKTSTSDKINVIWKIINRLPYDAEIKYL